MNPSTVAADSIKPGVDTTPHPVTPAGMDRVAESCEVCPLRLAAAAGERGGVEAEAHVLRVQAVELSRKLALTRLALRRLGVDPDIAYHPHEQDRA
jgi:hypothetical protein